MTNKELRKKTEEILMRVNVHHLEDEDYMLNHNEATTKLLSLTKEYALSVLPGKGPEEVVQENLDGTTIVRNNLWNQAITQAKENINE